MRQKMDVTVRGPGEPERFLAGEIEIKALGGPFVLTYDGEAGLIIKTPDYHPQAVLIDNDTINVYRVSLV